MKTKLIDLIGLVLTGIVLVNHGGATAQDILNLAKHIQETVLQKFGVPLQIEPNIFWIKRLLPITNYQIDEQSPASAAMIPPMKLSA